MASDTDFQSLGVHEFLSAKFGLTPPPKKKRGQNEEKLHKSVKKILKIDTFFGGGGEARFYLRF